MDAEEIIRQLAGRLTIETDTKSPAYSGSIYLITRLKLDDDVISECTTSLPDIADLKRAEYHDY